MKVGIITFHAVHNFGAVLQAYGLQDYLRRIGHDAYILDYRPQYLKERYKAFSLKRVFKKTSAKRIKLLLREFLTYPTLKRRNSFFCDFIDTYLRLISLEELENKNDFNAFVFGSDQIWNPLICNGLDPMFMGDFDAAVGKRLISYAGSLGSMKNLNSNEKNLLLRSLSSFYAISCRELEPAEFISKSLNRIVDVVLDPVLLAGKNTFDSIATKIIKDTPFLLLFSLGHNERISKVAYKLAQEKGLEVIEIVSYQVSLKKSNALQALSVLDFIGYIRSAEFVVTSSFHGTALSILFGKELYFVPDDPITGERGTNLLCMLGISDRVWDDNNVRVASLIDYDSVYNTLERVRKQSENFIKSALI